MQLRVLFGVIFLSALFCPQSDAVEIGTEGRGQVLIFPYYNTRNDNDTLISLTNPTKDVKAIKVQVLEGENGRVVLSLNLYLGPLDVWTANLGISFGSDGQLRLVSNDNSCTVPQDLRQASMDNILNLDSITGMPDGGRETADRLMEGYIRVIEMGTLPSGAGDTGRNALIFRNGIPVDCQFFVDAWFDDGQNPGVFRQDPQLQMQPPTGGLFGDALIIQVPGARAAAYEAVALDQFYVPTAEDAPSLHTAPESLTPDLSAASPPVSRTLLVEQQQMQIVEDTWNNGQQAVDAVLMAKRLRNQYATEAVITGRTEWVVTFPGKQNHVWQVAAPVPPYTTLFASPDSDIAACEDAEILAFDRDQLYLYDTGLVTPPPPGVLLHFCYEVNVVAFNNSIRSTENSTLNEQQGIVSDLFSSRLFDDAITVVDIVNSVDQTTGWADILFDGRVINSNGVSHALINSESGRIYAGLPAVGVALRGADNRALNALFAIGVEHFYVRTVTSD